MLVADLVKSSPLVAAAWLALFAACSSSSGPTGGLGTGDGGSEAAPSDDGGGSRDGGDSGTRGGDSGGGGLTWGCGDNGTDCLCYAPPPAGYALPACGAYSCCWAAQYVGIDGGIEHECECGNANPCTRASAMPLPAGPSAVQVGHCP